MESHSMSQSHNRTGQGPLTNITVLDLTRVLSGPYCTMMLSDMGARVIKVEQPGRGDETRAWGPPFQNGESTYFLSTNRNKESVTINFKHPDGYRLLEALIERSDVIVENFRPGTLDRLNLGYTHLANRFPRLIYCSISGYGQTGPKRSQPGYDAVTQAEGGLMSITGPEDGPPYRLGVAISDIVSGMFAAYGIVTSLLSRGQTGHGQLVDISMLDSVAALLTYQAGIYFGTGKTPRRMGNRHPSIVPYQSFETADADIVIAVGNDTLWRRFCDVLKLSDIADNPRFATNQARVVNHTDLCTILTETLKKRPRQAWLDELAQVGVPCGAVRNLEQVLTDPQLIEREMIALLDHPVAGALNVLGVPVKLSQSPGSVRTPPPLLGEHTTRVLAEDLGLGTEEIERLKKDGAI